MSIVLEQDHKDPEQLKRTFVEPFIKCLSGAAQTDEQDPEEGQVVDFAVYPHYHNHDEADAIVIAIFYLDGTAELKDTQDFLIDWRSGRISWTDAVKKIVEMVQEHLEEEVERIEKHTKPALEAFKVLA